MASSYALRRKKTKDNSGKGTTYCSGDKVAESGIYDIKHHLHREHHEAVFLKGGVFPACRVCGERIRFQLNHGAPYIAEDPDFGELPN